VYGGGGVREVAADCGKPKPRWKFVQPNTVVVRGENGGEGVEMRVYEESNRRVVRSWAERGV
jgi:hypothetical protein